MTELIEYAPKQPNHEIMGEGWIIVEVDESLTVDHPLIQFVAAGFANEGVTAADICGGLPPKSVADGFYVVHEKDGEFDLAGLVVEHANWTGLDDVALFYQISVGEGIDYSNGAAQVINKMYEGLSGGLRSRGPLVVVDQTPAETQKGLGEIAENALGQVGILDSNDRRVSAALAIKALVIVPKDINKPTEIKIHAPAGTQTRIEGYTTIVHPTQDDLAPLDMVRRDLPEQVPVYVYDGQPGGLLEGLENQGVAFSKESAITRFATVVRSQTSSE